MASNTLATAWDTISQLFYLLNVPPLNLYAPVASELSMSPAPAKDDPPEKSLPVGASVKKNDRSTFKVRQYGIWTIWDYVPPWVDNLPGASVLKDLSGFAACLPYMSTLLHDLHHLGLFVCTAYLVAMISYSILPTIRLAQTSRFLLMVESAIKTGEIDKSAFYWAIFLQFFLSITEWATSETTEWCTPILQQRFRYHFKQRMIDFRLRLDLPTSELPDVKAKLEAADSKYDGGTAWDAFEKLVGLAGLVLELVSQSGYVIGTMLHQPGGKTIVALCLVGPMARIMYYRQWGSVFWAKVTNEPYVRMRTMFNFATSTEAKVEVIGNAMEGYVASEFRRARTEFGDITEDYPWGSMERPFSFYSCVRELASEGAIVVLAVKIVFDPVSIPLTSMAMLEQTTRSMTSTLYRICNGGSSLMETLNTVKSLYEVDMIPNQMHDGDLGYPPPETKDALGMKVEFRDVSFKYPNNEATVIDKLSFTVPAGCLCVIVGENGCGKSSTIKLLNRLYDVTGGEILIDDRPIKDYRMRDVRAATAVMHQEYQHFDLSLRENIGLGNPISESVNDLDAIKRAAQLGGAHDFIEKLPAGYETQMSDNSRTWSNGTIPEGSALDKLVKSQPTPQKAFSGGETQRLALSRTFMRSTTCDVKILAYDEPSAALDPKAEFALFERLRNLREGKTMIFVTHRFGYLTKYADSIIYMEQGRAVEQGSHQELLALNGKYANLYNVQAQAFS